MSLRTAVDEVYVFQLSYSTYRAGNETNILTFINGKASNGESKCYLVRGSFRPCENSNFTHHKLVSVLSACQ